MKIKLGTFGILERDGKTYLLRRSQDDTSFAGKWCHPGGGIEYGEPSTPDALKREFLEETGLEITIGDYCQVHDFITPDRHVVLIFRNVFADGNPTPSDGHDIGGWFTQEEISSMEKDGLLTPLGPIAQNAFSEWKSKSKK